jgi:hypothetical protein
MHVLSCPFYFTFMCHLSLRAGAEKWTLGHVQLDGQRTRATVFTQAADARWPFHCMATICFSTPTPVRTPLKPSHYLYSLL